VANRVSTLNPRDSTGTFFRRGSQFALNRNGRVVRLVSDVQRLAVQVNKHNRKRFIAMLGS